VQVQLKQLAKSYEYSIAHVRQVRQVRHILCATDESFRVTQLNTCMKIIRLLFHYSSFSYTMVVVRDVIEFVQRSCVLQGYFYAGAQCGTQCFCGNEYGTYGKSNSCIKPCVGLTKYICGGPWANTVMFNGV